MYAIRLAIAPVFLPTGIGAMIALICGLALVLREGHRATHAGPFETRRITR